MTTTLSGPAGKPPRSIRAPDWLTLVSALLIVAAFPPWDLSFLAWFCLIPWFMALKRAPSLKAAFIQGVWLSFFMSLGGFFWVASVLHQFGGLPWPVSVLGLLLFGLGGQPQFLLFPLIQRVFYPADPEARGARTAMLAVIAALAYTGLDWVIPKLFADTLGHAFYEAPRLRQLADLGGAHLLTFLAFLVNDTLWRLILRIRERKEPSLWPALQGSAPQAAVAIALCVLAVLYGNARRNTIQALTAQAPAAVQGAAIQGNIGDFDKIASERGVRGAAEKVLSTYFSLSDRALEMERKPEFLVWPETAYPSTFRTPSTADELFRDQKVEAFVRERGVPLLFGGYDRWKGKDFNALFALNPKSPKSDPELASLGGGGGDLQVYRKNMLLLFGEYIPGAEHIKFLRDAFPQVGNFGRGVGPDVLRVPLERLPSRSLGVGPIICYEALFPNYVIQAARKGTQLILNITNDSWFGPFGEPHLHLALVAFRSIETRLPQLRSTNTGISALILPDGSITEPTAIGEPAILNVSIPVVEPIPTLMKAWGDWFGLFALLAGATGLLGFYGATRARLSGETQAPPR